MLERGWLALVDTITKESAQRTIVELRRMDSVSDKEITLVISSEGGNAKAGFEIYEAIRSLRSPVTGLVSGSAGSMALVVLQACTKRSMLPKARLHPHQISTLYESSCPDSQRAIEVRMSEYEDRLVNILLEKTGISSRQAVLNVLDANGYFEAEEALRLGFVDEIFRSAQ